MNTRSSRWRIRASTALLLAAACTGPAPTDHGDHEPAAAKAAGDPAVTSTVPSETEQGTTLDVRVLGSGFDDGSKVTLLLDGVATGKVVTNSTRYVSAKELVANITVALDAVTDAYDVQVVTLKGKKGIGTEMFEVRTITALPTLGGSTAFAEDVNDAGVLTGGATDLEGYSKPFVWSEAQGMIPLPVLPGFLRGRGRAINNAGLIAGSVGGTPRPVRWVPSGSTWEVEALGSFGSADGTGEAFDINESGTIVGNSQTPAGPSLPYLWDEGLGMRALTLPPGAYGGQARGINDRGEVVGFINFGDYDGSAQSAAAVWPIGGGVQLLPLPGTYEGSLAAAINEDGVIVGKVSQLVSRNRQASAGVRWLPNPAQPGSWLPAEILIDFNGSMFEDIDVDGRIVGWVPVSSGTKALLWEPGMGLHVLGGFTRSGYSYARGINNPTPGQIGLIAGQSSGSSIPDKAVVWMRF